MENKSNQEKIKKWGEEWNQRNRNKKPYARGGREEKILFLIYSLVILAFMIGVGLGVLLTK